MLDPRLTPARPDLAAAHLRGRVEAARFVEGRPMRVVDAAAPLRRAPSPDAALDTEALHGETLQVYDADDEGWAWGQLDGDGYVGWLPLSALDGPGPAPTHRVAALRTFVFPEPDFKRPPLMALPLGARVHVARRHGDYAATERGFVYARHLAPAGTPEPDPVAVAERLVGTPYLWGGRTSLGLDCSGLVQLALQAAGMRSPRDTDMMERGLGVAVPLADDLAGLARGDLVFWKGHVGLMLDGTRLLHANATHMMAAIEPLPEARSRIAAMGFGPITSVRRLEGLGVR